MRAARTPTCEPADTSTAGPIRFCCCSNRNGTSAAWLASRWTDRCPAEEFSRGSGKVDSGIESAIRYWYSRARFSGPQLQKRCLENHWCSGRTCHLMRWSASRIRRHLRRVLDPALLVNPPYTRPVHAPMAALPPPYECRMASASAARGSLWMATSTPPRPVSTSKMRPSCG